MNPFHELPYYFLKTHFNISHSSMLKSSKWSRSFSFPTKTLSTGLFISPSGTSELDCATTKNDTAERSISIGRESLKVFFVLGALAYLQVPPLGGSRDEKWRAQWIRKRSMSWNLPKLSQLWRCNGGFGRCTAQNHLRTKQFVSGTWNSSRVAACALQNEEAGWGRWPFFVTTTH